MYEIKRKFSHAVRAVFRCLPLRKRVLFYSIRADDRLLENAACVFDAVSSKKLIFAHKLPHDEKTRLKQYYCLLTSKVIVTDDYLRYLRSVKLRRGQHIVQVWHAGGHMKKFGLDAPSRLTREEEIATHSQYDAVIVSAEACRRFFAGAMGIDVEKILALGMPRTDELLDSNSVASLRRGVIERNAILSGKKIYLYAPTFREVNGNRVAYNPMIDWDKLDNELGDDELFVIHTHPMQREEFLHSEYKHIIDLTDETTSALLSVAAAVITDYSTVILDASLLDVPSIFYCPDFDSYERDFYIKFSEELPGEMLTSSDKLLDTVRSTVADPPLEAIKNFRHEHMGACDGKSTERVAALVMKLINE